MASAAACGGEVAATSLPEEGGKVVRPSPGEEVSSLGHIERRMVCLFTLPAQEKRAFGRDSNFP